MIKGITLYFTQIRGGGVIFDVFDENLHLDNRKKKAVSHLCNTAWRAQTDIVD